MQHQMVNIVFVVLLVMIIKMSRIDKTIKVAQTEGESLLASSALNVLSLQQQVKRRSELSLSFNSHFLRVVATPVPASQSNPIQLFVICIEFCILVSIFLKTNFFPEGCFSHIQQSTYRILFYFCFFCAFFCENFVKRLFLKNHSFFEGCFSDIQRIHRRSGAIQQVLMSFLYFYNDAAFDR